MGRRSGPTLYEVMSRSAAASGRSTPSRQPHVTSESERPAASRLISPGRVVRLPVGFMWMGIGGIILLIALAFAMGYSRGNTTAASEARKIAEGLDERLREGSRVRDPLVVEQEQSPIPARVIDEAPKIPIKAPRRAVQSRASEAGDYSPDEDVRKVGMAYFFAETPLKGRAREIVQFIRDNGLDAIQISAEDERFRQIIVLPGFEPSDVNRKRQLRKQIIDIGEKFHKLPGNNDHFNDTFHATFRG